MSCNRVRRQQFHTWLCIAALFLAEALLFWAMGAGVFMSALFLVLNAAGSRAAGALDAGMRKWGGLVVRYGCAAAVSGVLTGLIVRDIPKAVQMTGAAFLLYCVWAGLSGLWMRHELCPGWTLLVYDSAENQKKAEALAGRYPELIKAVQGFFYGKNTGQEMDRIVNAHRIPQLLVCLDGQDGEVLEYCREKGITAFVPDRKRTGLRCFSPVSGHGKKNHGYGEKRI